MSKKHSWSEYEEYFNAHPKATTKDAAEHFGVTPGGVASICMSHGFSTRDARRKNFILGIDKQTFIDFAANHTPREIADHFNLKLGSVHATMYQHQVPHLKVMPKTECDVQRKLKRTGEAHDMIKTLGQTYNYAAIARVFGYTKERVRQICLEE